MITITNHATGATAQLDEHDVSIMIADLVIRAVDSKEHGAQFYDRKIARADKLRSVLSA